MGLRIGLLCLAGLCMVLFLALLFAMFLPSAGQPRRPLLGAFVAIALLGCLWVVWYALCLRRAPGERGAARAEDPARTWPSVEGPGGGVVDDTVER
jgi:threonine/homoserine/homoserine lactone efflux protein